jgi:hypothetical protein
MASEKDLMLTKSEDLAMQIRHMRHPVKDGLLTLAGDEDCDIPSLTAEFCFGAAQLEHSDVSDCN